MDPIAYALAVKVPATTSQVETFWGDGTGTSARRTYGYTKMTTDVGLMTGGLNSGGSGQTLVSVYDIVANAWTSKAALPEARNSHRQATLTDGRVLVVGGVVAGSNTADVRVYDPGANTWANKASLPAVRYNFGMSTLATGLVLVSAGSLATDTDTTLVYDPVANTWTSKASIPGGVRQGASQVTLADGRALLVGGGTTAAKTLDCYLYDPTANTWAATGSLNYGRTAPAITLIPDGKALVIGTLNSYVAATYKMELYDPAAGTWAYTGRDFPIQIAEANAALLNDSIVSVPGGNNLAVGVVATHTRYQPLASKPVVGRAALLAYLAAK